MPGKHHLRGFKIAPKKSARRYAARGRCSASSLGQPPPPWKKARSAPVRSQFCTISMQVNGRKCGYCSSTEQLKKNQYPNPLSLGSMWSAIPMPCIVFGLDIFTLQLLVVAFHIICNINLAHKELKCFLNLFLHYIIHYYEFFKLSKLLGEGAKSICLPPQYFHWGGGGAGLSQDRRLRQRSRKKSRIFPTHVRRLL